MASARNESRTAGRPSHRSTRTRRWVAFSSRARAFYLFGAKSRRADDEDDDCCRRCSASRLSTPPGPRRRRPIVSTAPVHGVPRARIWRVRDSWRAVRCVCGTQAGSGAGWVRTCTLHGRAVVQAGPSGSSAGRAKSVPARLVRRGRGCPARPAPTARPPLDSTGPGCGDDHAFTSRRATDGTRAPGRGTAGPDWTGRSTVRFERR